MAGDLYGCKRALVFDSDSDCDPDTDADTENPPFMRRVKESHVLQKNKDFGLGSTRKIQ
jgi:hypothetical protein